jgi:hypothetical protein
MSAYLGISWPGMPEKKSFAGGWDPDIFQKLFDRTAKRAKVKIRPGHLYSREKVRVLNAITFL